MRKIVLFLLMFLCLLLNSSIIIGNNDLDKAIKLLEAEKYEEAKTILEEIINKDDQNAGAYYYLGRTFMALRDYEEASDNFEESIDLNDKVADYHFWLGQAYASDARESSFFTQAILAPKILDQFEKTVELDPDHIGGRIGMANFYMQAPGIMGGDIDKALEQGRKLVELDERRGRIIMANVYIEKEQLDSADVQMNLLEQKYGSDKSQASIYNTYGYLLLGQNRIDEAIEKFKKQIELIPDRANPYDSLGDAYWAAGRLEDAIAQYEKALKIDPNFEASKNNLEEVREELKDLNN